jgi:Skp family chaperone for outer membrane proteins
MKIKTIYITGLIGLVLILCGLAFSASAGKPAQEQTPLTANKIGIVSFRKVFQNCKRNEKYRVSTKADQEKAIAELEQLRKEIEAAEAGLKTRKAGTKDYLDLAQDIAQKKAQLPVRQDFYEQQFSQKDKDWTELLYKDILTSVNKVAAEKRLELVFEKDVPEFPYDRADELMLAVRTTKVLYSGKGCTDITNDVMTIVDANTP